MDRIYIYYIFDNLLNEMNYIKINYNVLKLQ